MSNLHDKTRSAFFWTRILRTPLWAIYGMLPFILFRDLQANPFQIALVIGIKPAVSILSLYWSSFVAKRPDRLVSNIIWANLLGALPFLFFPFTNTLWYFIFAYGAYMLFHRGVVPAWMEMMKLNLHDNSREKTFAAGSAFGYLGDAFFPFLFGPLMDSYVDSWRWIFFAASLISMLSIFSQLKLHVPRIEVAETISFKKLVFKPWKEAWALLKARPDFRHFQLGFMFGGAGLMVMQVVLPQYLMGVLEVSYTELAIALTLCKGVGFALTSQIWANLLKKTTIFRICAQVTLLAACYPICLFAAKSGLSWLYLAYVIYGVMQAGSELAWNLSGPIFAPKEDSSVYSSVNVLTVGLRGCLAPLAAGMLYQSFGPIFVLMLGGGCCLAATLWMSFGRTVPETLLNRNAQGR